MPNLLKYDVIYIADPNSTTEELAAVSAKIEQITADTQGTVLKKDDWGKRRLAYLVKKHREGHYVFFHLSITTEAIAEITRNLRLMEKVIKFSVVRDEISHLKPKIKPRKPGNPEAAHHRPGAPRTSGSYRPSSSSTSAPTAAPAPAVPAAAPTPVAPVSTEPTAPSQS